MNLLEPGFDAGFLFIGFQRTEKGLRPDESSVSCFRGPVALRRLEVSGLWKD